MMIMINLLHMEWIVLVFKIHQALRCKYQTGLPLLNVCQKLINFKLQLL
jgi:hypothetical protein